MTTAAPTITLANQMAAGHAATRRRLPRPIWTALVLTRFIRGYCSFLRTGITPNESYADMRRLFRMTGGWFNDLLGRISTFVHPPRRISSSCGVLGTISDADVHHMARQLRRTGLLRAECRIPDGICDRIRDWAMRTPCRPYPAPNGTAVAVLFDPNRPIAATYRYAEQALLGNPDIQRIVTDPTLLRVAQGALGCCPQLAACDMWWSAAVPGPPSTEAAQYFHFDMSQIRFVKFFLYLTDVDLDHGPHQFVPYSHRRLPAQFRDDRRYSDQEIESCFGRKSILNLTGPRGTMFFEDTRGFHKGIAPRSGNRLLFQLVYANSCFGEQASCPASLGNISPQFAMAIREFPLTFARYHSAWHSRACPNHKATE